MIKNYFSGLIENLGVVPWLRLAALRFVPIFFFLFSRTRRVCLVLEDMVLSSFKIKTLYVTAGLLIVKTLFFSSLSAEVLTLSRGELREIQRPGLTSFTQGNKELLGVHYEPPRLLIKGKKIGMTDVLLWLTDGSSQKLTIYVLSKKELLTLRRLVQKLQNLGLKPEIQGPIIEVKGQLTKINSLREFHVLSQKYSEKLLHKLTLSRSLKKQVLGQLYQELYQDQYYDSRCWSEQFSFYCSLSSVPKKSFQQRVQRFYPLTFLEHSSQVKQQNFHLRYTLFQVEASHQSQISSGLAKIQGRLLDLLAHKPESFFAQNHVVLEDSTAKVLALHQVKVLLKIDSAAKFSLGTEIPFTISTLQGRSQRWKFFGLQTQFLLTQKDSQLLLQQKTRFSQSPQENLRQGLQESTFFIRKDTPFFLFQTSLHNHSSNRSALPFFSKLFRSKSKQHSSKKVLAFVILE